jgi:hypothetical protein
MPLGHLRPWMMIKPADVQDRVYPVSTFLRNVLHTLDASWCKYSQVALQNRLCPSSLINMHVMRQAGKEQDSDVKCSFSTCPQYLHS